jgi:5-methylcytosine-specific restriction endonuclease McrA
MEVGFERYFRKPNVNKMTYEECLAWRDQMISEVLAIEKNFVSPARLQQLKDAQEKKYQSLSNQNKLEKEIFLIRRDSNNWENGKGIFNGMFADKVLTPKAEELILGLQLERKPLSYEFDEQHKEELNRQLELLNFRKIRYNVLDALTKRIKNFEYAKAQKESKKRQLEELKVRAAANESDIRKIAESVKDKLFISDVCPYCGLTMSAGNFHADHIYPVSKGGQSRVSNMVLCCSECNLKKKALTVREFALKYRMDRAEIERRLEMQNKTF